MFPDNPGIKRIGIWVRVSTEDQARGESPEVHEKRARLYAEAKGWQAIELYSLAGISGKSVFAHPETERMLEDVKRQRISALIFSKIARLARNTKELLEISDIFRSCGADLVSLNEAIDTTSPAGRLFYTMIAALAQWEREEIAERVIASVPIRAKLGKPLGGAAPFGYRWLNKKLIVEPNEAVVRKYIYEAFLKLRNKQAVARLINTEGYKTRGGCQFTITTIDRILRDTVSKGEHRSNYCTRAKHGSGWIYKPLKEWVFTRVEPIVSENVWEECKRLLDSESEKKIRAPRVPHPFARVVFCLCGDNLHARLRRKEFCCLKCRNTIKFYEIEELAILYIKKLNKSKNRRNQYPARQLLRDCFVRLRGTSQHNFEKNQDKRPQSRGRCRACRGNEQNPHVIKLVSRWSSLDSTRRRHLIEDILDRIIVGPGLVEFMIRPPCACRNPDLPSVAFNY